MIKHSISNIDNRYIFLISDTKGEMLKLEEYLNKIPSYMFLPSFSGVPNPEVHLDSFVKNGKKIYFCFSGLYKEIITWCQKNGIKTTLTLDMFRSEPGISLEDFKAQVLAWNLKYTPYEYQLEAAYNIISYNQSLSEIATRAGKTLIGYIIFRWLMEEGKIKNILMICPSVFLVKQGHQDFSEYAEFFKTDTVWAQGEMCSSSNLTIGTFQSLVKKCDKKSSKYNPKFFDKFDCVLVDEVHNAKAKSIKMILQQDFMKRVKYRFGFSGTLPLDGTLESFNVQELMGGKIQDITSKELRDGGYISEIEIKQIRIKYPSMEQNENIKNLYMKCGEYLCSNYVMNGTKQVLRSKENREFNMIHEKKLPFALTTYKKQSSKEEYINYLVDLCKAQGSNLLTLENYVAMFSQKKINIIKDIVSKCDGNTILFFHYKEYCRHVYNILKESFPNKEVIIMTGDTNIKKRGEIQEMMKIRDDVIFCASYGVSSTGLTLRLEYGIFVESFKSHIIVKQSAGRGLCLDPSSGKEKFVLYDIIDCLPDTKRIYMQGLHKCKLYKQEEFNYRIIEK